MSDQNNEDKPRLGRRSMVLRLGVLGAAGTTAACVPPPGAYAPAPAYRGTGITDADPNDGPGNGRGGYRRGTGITDADPNDGPGNGRGGYRGGYRTGLTDSDPSDGPGRGRRGY